VPLYRVQTSETGNNLVPKSSIYDGDGVHATENIDTLKAYENDYEYKNPQILRIDANRSVKMLNTYRPNISNSGLIPEHEHWIENKNITNVTPLKRFGDLLIPDVEKINVEEDNTNYEQKFIQNSNKNLSISNTSKHGNELSLPPEII
jgi:hypothetical protein